MFGSEQVPRMSLNQLTARDLELPTLVRAAAEAGFAGIGLLPSTVQALGTDRTATLLAEAGLAPTSVCAVIGLTARDPAEHRGRVAEALAVLEQAAALGVPLVVVVGGPQAGFGRAAALEQVHRAVDVLLDRAAVLGTQVLIEPLHPVLVSLSVLTSLEESLRLLAGRRHGGAVLDTWHVWNEPGLPATVDDAVAAIPIVHLADWAPQPPGTLDRELPGRGVAELPALCAGLLRAGFEGWWEVEVLSEAYWSSDQVDLVHQAHAAAVDVLAAAAGEQP